MWKRANCFTVKFGGDDRATTFETMPSLRSVIVSKVVYLNLKCVTYVLAQLLPMLLLTEMAPLLMSAGELTLPECTFTPQWGFGFSHWNGISCTYDPGDTIEVSRNMSFTAVYESHTTYVNIRGEVTSFGAPEESVTITLYKEGETEPFLKEVKSGNSVTYNFPYVEAGTYVLTVQKAGHVDYRATVYTGLSDVTHNVDLEMNLSEVLLGDINGDGEVNAKDSNLLKQMLSGSIEFPAGSRENLAADINGDGEISAKDSNLIKQIISGL